MKKNCDINACSGQEKRKYSHLSTRNETKWSKANLFATLCSYKSSIRVTITENNNVCKTIWKNRNKKCNKKYICCFFTKWNLKSAITCKCGRVVLSRLFCHQQTHTVIFVFFSCTMLYTFQRLFLYCTFHVFLLKTIDRNPKQVLITKWVICFLKLKNIFLLFSTFWKWFTELCFDVDQRYETRR